MNQYEARQEARRARLEARAERLGREADSAFKRADLSEAGRHHTMTEQLGGGLCFIAFLNGGDLRGASLTDAYLKGAYLTDADLTGARLPAFQLPQEGELIVYKAVGCGVCKLRVPPEARRTASLVGRKCRAEFVEVLEGVGFSRHDPAYQYEPGKVVRPDSYDDDVRVECTHGIHFFLTREEAAAYA